MAILARAQALLWVRDWGFNSKKETQLGKFELSPVKKGLNSKSLKIFDARAATFEACKKSNDMSNLEYMNI
jgi:hypothetical protein